MSVIVFVDTQNEKVTKTSLEAVAYASKIAQSKNKETIAVSYNNADFSVLGEYGADKVVVAKNIKVLDSKALASVVSIVATEQESDTVIFSQDTAGKAIAPRVSVRLKAGLVSGAVSLPELEGDFTVKKAVFSGKAFAKVKVNSDIRVIAITPNSYGLHKSETKNVTVEDFQGNIESTLTVEKVIATEGGVALPDAEIVVSGGRGLKGPENWGMIEEMANTLGAATACSRPVSDIGWRPHHEHVGQTGLTVRPNLYFAIGISGAIQHLAGVNSSKVIVAINTDPEAPFFKAADYGIVGDAFEVVPKLNEALKKFKSN